MQVDQLVLDQEEATGIQSEMFIDSPDDDRFQGIQAEMKVETEDPTGIQALMVKGTTDANGMQSDQKIVDEDDDRFQGIQAEMKVDTEATPGFQSDQITTENFGMSATMSLYNQTQFRVLCDFSSRGTPALGGTNWVSVPTEDAGDFSPNNLNTDIVEQRTQVSPVPALWRLEVDTGVSNTFVDTIGILEHNLTIAATVQFQASNDPLFSTIEFSINMTVELDNMYYIAPTLPTTPARYFRFLIQDPSNTSGKLSIGTIVFGSAVVTTTKECFSNPIIYGKRHFKDTLPVEGFNTVSNDRAIRHFLGLRFEQLEFDGANFELLQEYYCTAKTDLKCLVIPRPETPSAFAVFAKLVTLPEEQHNAIDVDNHYVQISLEWDESL
jgi:hypothetical protein